MSAAAAARAAGLHENTIYLLESDKKNDGVTVRVCKQVADIYGVPLGEIFGQPSAEYIPAEFRPLQDLLRPLDMDARVSFIRNVVSNAKFMSQLIAVRDADHSGVSDTATTMHSEKTIDRPTSINGRRIIGEGEPIKEDVPRVHSPESTRGAKRR